jgi:arylsulfatase A-like enzyme
MSMGAMFTGRTPSIESGEGKQTIRLTGRTWCGMARFAGGSSAKSCIPRSISTLAERLREAGYWTIGVVSKSLLFAPFGMERGVDEWVEVGEVWVPWKRLSASDRDRLYRSRSAKAVNANTGEAIKRRPHDRLFLYVHYMDVHDYGWVSDRGYWASVPTVDRALGDLLRSLDTADLLEGSAIIFTSDHGERLGEMHLVRGENSHRGNPSFEEVLQVPLITVPPLLENPDQLMRTQDVFHLITRLAGVGVDAPPELQPGELFLSEARWRTYRRGRWKSFVRRADGSLYLVDLARDAGESRDVSAEYPDVARQHEERMLMLAQELAVRRHGPDQLSEEDQRRLRTLGYID